MATKVMVRGSLPEIIRNDYGVYEGDLRNYFRAIFFNAQNLQYPYHNFRHMLHVAWLCYEACLFYGDTLSWRKKRNLLVAAMFHDFDHSGTFGYDSVNIARAIRGFQKHIEPEDLAWTDEIIQLIECTEYPYKTPSGTLPLSGRIIRDADLCQAFNAAWIQQVVFGLAAEWGKKPIDVLRAQGSFCESLRFSSDWARETFTQEEIDRKIAEARELLEILDGEP